MTIKYMSLDDITVRAILSGHKTQMRLPIRKGEKKFACNDIIIGREAWAFDGDPSLFKYVYRSTGDVVPRWRSPMHMEITACRIFLAVQEVRIEPLKALSMDDAMQEGVTRRTFPSRWIKGDQTVGYAMDWCRVGTKSKYAGPMGILTEQDVCLGSPQNAFGAYWNEKYGRTRTNCRWEDNPMVTVLSFKVHHKI